MSIPRLDGEPIGGPGGEPLTMQEQALRQRELGAAPQAGFDPNFTPAPPHRTHASFQPLTTGQATGPGVMRGVGSAYQGNQPFVQAPDGRRISESTLAQLDAAGRMELEQFQNRAEGTQKEAIAGKMRGAETQDEAVGKVMKELGLDDPELLAQIQEEGKGKLEKKAVRDAIEARLTPISLEQMIDDGEARQEVPIVRPSITSVGLTPTFRTIQGHENLAIHRVMRGDGHLGANYVRDRYLLLRLTAGMFSLNKDPLPDHLDKNGKWDDDLFAGKMQIVGRYPLPMLSVLSINYGWFAERAEDVFLDVDGLKNG